MTAVGMFAGRGDVVLGYLVCLLAGVAMGWFLRGQARRFHDWRVKRKAGG